MYKYNIRYNRRCVSFGAWLLHSWSFYTTVGLDRFREDLNLPSKVNSLHESGIRIFGLSISRICFVVDARVRN